MSKEDRRVSPELIVEGLGELADLPPDHQEHQRVSSYELASLLDYLRAPEIDEEQLGLLEWRLLPALGFDARSPVLERRLARDPEFFVEILSLVYRPRGTETETVDTPEHVATNAYRILDEWEIVPGSGDRMGEIDQGQLDRWVDEARKLARDVGRAEVADVQIGKVLAHAICASAPMAPDSRDHLTGLGRSLEERTRLTQSSRRRRLVQRSGARP